ncbi:hypothetical protein [Micromonospora rosaria]|uniref:hypothetical protein n=1 Tax=Micromonospora rosaria TaxID=47874 RepID=UPI000B31E189|nr:hypothetical protein [Micromonospora rosaria]
MAKQQGKSRKQDDRDQRESAEKSGRDWADEAAQARTADDPRAVAPHDAAGRPSIGNP